MLTRLRLQNFKSWKDTGDIPLKPITVFFGANSSGKTSLLQAPLLLKQTYESSDRAQVFHFGNGQTPVDLGDYSNVVHGHDAEAQMHLEFRWVADSAVGIRDPTKAKENIAHSKSLGFRVVTSQHGKQAGQPIVNEMGYCVGDAQFGMRHGGKGHDLFSEGAEFRFVRRKGRAWSLPAPIRCYGFPTEVRNYYQNADFLADLEHHFERQLRRIFYLGPLRAHPERRYDWAGARPSDMGRAGQSAVDAILAARAEGDLISLGRGVKRRTLEEHVAYWLRQLGLIHDFKVEPVAEGLPVFQVAVRKTTESVPVPITDVGFGVSQILPVLVLCFYAPEGATIILEQPEIHLHPAIQSGLADVLIDAQRYRRVQILLESHSEHLLRRLQRRVAEEKMDPDKVGLWFCETSERSSQITKLRLDMFGNIENWPREFFGDEFGEIAEMGIQQARRRAQG